MAKELMGSPKSQKQEGFSLSFPSAGELYQVYQLKWWIFEHFVQDKVSVEEHGLAEQIIAEYEALQQKHDELWSDLSCGNADVIESWQACTEANQRWEVLRASLKVTNSLTQAYQIAFKHFQPEPLAFVNPSEQDTFIGYLRAQQTNDHANRSAQADLKAYDPKNVISLRWDEPDLSYIGKSIRLRGVHSSLMTALFSGNPRSSKDLLREVLGVKYGDSKTLGKLTRKIYALNKRLIDGLGAPPDGKKYWIRGHALSDGYAYTLKNPNFSA